MKNKLNLPPIKQLNFCPPEPEHFTLDNGMLVYYLKDDTVSLLHLQALLCAGSVYDKPGQEGLAKMAISLLRNGGSEKCSADLIDKSLEDMAASIDTEVLAESAMLELGALKQDFPNALSIFSDLLYRPAFEPEKTELERAALIEAAARQNDDPARSAMRKALCQLFGKSHPYGASISKNSISSITIKALKAWHKNYINPKNIILAAAGSFKSKEHLKRLLNLKLGAIKPKPILPFPQFQRLILNAI